jgi:uncharacterized membrane protein AbrB (regulator of aidB expression)
VTARAQLARVAFGVALLVHVVVLYAPEATGPGSLPIPHLDKIAHVAVFAAVAWTGRWVGLPAGPLLGALAAHAVGSEVLQHLALPRRSGDPADVVADLAGVALGAALPRPRRTGADGGLAA